MTSSTNSANTNNTVTNTNSYLTPSSIDEEIIEYEECDTAYAAQQDGNEKVPVLNSDQWDKGTTLIVGDSMLAGLIEAKLSRSRKIKVRYF